MKLEQAFERFMAVKERDLQHLHERIIHLKGLPAELEQEIYQISQDLENIQGDFAVLSFGHSEENIPSMLNQYNYYYSDKERNK